MTYRLNSVLKIPVANVYRKLIPGMAGVWPPKVFNCVWFMDPTSPESKSVYETFNFSLKLLGVLSKRLA